MNTHKETGVHIKVDVDFQMNPGEENGVHLNSNDAFHNIRSKRDPDVQHGLSMGHRDGDGCLGCQKCQLCMFNEGLLCQTVM